MAGRRDEDEVPEAPSGIAQDDSYVSRSGHKNEPLPVQSDSDKVESGVNPETADSDAQLERDDNEAIDKSNIMGERTRGAGKPSGTYRDPGDEEGLPDDTGVSSGRQ